MKIKRHTFFQKGRIKTWWQGLSVSDKSSFINTCFWGVIAASLAVWISTKTQTVKDIDNLLKETIVGVKTSTYQLDTLAEINKRLSVTIMILNTQLELDRKQQKQSEINSGFTRDANIARLKLNRKKMVDLVRSEPNYNWGDSSIFMGKNMKPFREYSLKFREDILEEISNPIVLENKELTKKWWCAYDTINTFLWWESISHGQYHNGTTGMNFVMDTSHSMCKTLQNLWLREVNNNDNIMQSTWKYLDKLGAEKYP